MRLNSVADLRAGKQEPRRGHREPSFLSRCAVLIPQHPKYPLDARVSDQADGGLFPARRERRLVQECSRHQVAPTPSADLGGRGNHCRSGTFAFPLMRPEMHVQMAICFEI